MENKEVVSEWEEIDLANTTLTIMNNSAYILINRHYFNINKIKADKLYQFKLKFKEIKKKQEN